MLLLHIPQSHSLALSNRQTSGNKTRGLRRCCRGLGSECTFSGSDHRKLFGQCHIGISAKNRLHCRVYAGEPPAEVKRWRAHMASVLLPHAPKTKADARRKFLWDHVLNGDVAVRGAALLQWARLLSEWDRKLAGKASRALCRVHPCSRELPSKKLAA